MVYLINFNITFIIILATCFESCESSSGIQELLVYIVLLFLCLTDFFVLVQTLQYGSLYALQNQS